MKENKSITHFDIDGEIYQIVSDQHNINNLAFKFNEETQGITSYVVPIDPEQLISIEPQAGKRAFACGAGCKALMPNSIAMGKNCITTGSGYGSIAIGSDAIASGDGAIALGHGVQATNIGAVALGGSYTVAGGITSMAVGNSANATGDYSIAFGRSVYAKGKYSMTFGSSLVADRDYMVVTGKLNKKDLPDSLFTIGNGFWYDSDDQIILESIPQLTEEQIEAKYKEYNEQIIALQDEAERKINALNPEDDDYQEKVNSISNELDAELARINENLEYLTLNKNLQYKSQPVCALQITPKAEAIWNSRREIGSTEYTTTKYIVAKSNEYVYLDSSFKLKYIDDLPTETFDITVMSNSGDGDIIKAFGSKTNFIAQVYSSIGVNIYRYTGTSYRPLTVNLEA